METLREYCSMGLDTYAAPHRQALVRVACFW